MDNTYPINGYNVALYDFETEDAGGTVTSTAIIFQKMLRYILIHASINRQR